jgi:hypothetical protein
MSEAHVDEGVLVWAHQVIGDPESWLLRDSRSCSSARSKTSKR